MKNEILTLKDFVDKSEKIKKEEMFKIVLKCFSCGYRDLFGKFLSKASDYWGNSNGIVFLYGEKYSEYFYCPKCKSSIVGLDDKFIKHNLFRILEK